MEKEKVWGEAGHRRRFDGKWTDVYQALADEKLGKEENNKQQDEETGEVVTKDLTKAAELYQKSADQGEPAAQYNLGRR